MFVFMGGGSLLFEVGKEKACPVREDSGAVLHEEGMKTTVTKNMEAQASRTEIHDREGTQKRQTVPNFHLCIKRRQENCPLLCTDVKSVAKLS